MILRVKTQTSSVFGASDFYEILRWEYGARMKNKISVVEQQIFHAAHLEGFGLPSLAAINGVCTLIEIVGLGFSKAKPPVVRLCGNHMVCGFLQEALRIDRSHVGRPKTAKFEEPFKAKTKLSSGLEFQHADTGRFGSELSTPCDSMFRNRLTTRAQARLAEALYSPAAG